MAARVRGKASISQIVAFYSGNAAAAGQVVDLFNGLSAEDARAALAIASDIVKGKASEDGSDKPRTRRASAPRARSRQLAAEGNGPAPQRQRRARTLTTGNSHQPVEGEQRVVGEPS